MVHILHMDKRFSRVNLTQQITYFWNDFFVDGVLVGIIKFIQGFIGGSSSATIPQTKKLLAST
jgi:hypothetical protein